MKQQPLLDSLEGIIRSMLARAYTAKMLPDDLAKRVLQNHNLPIRKFQALLLTGNAFMGMSIADAADIMEVSVQCVKNYLVELRDEYPSLVSFESMWSILERDHDRPGSFHTPINIDAVDDETITQLF